MLASDDDSGPGTDSRIVYTPGSSGSYYIDAGGFGDNQIGTYRVSVTDTSRIRSDFEAWCASSARKSK